MNIVSLNTGRPQLRMRGGRQYSTAIDRTPVQGPVALSLGGLDGDRVSDERVHGGPERALCAFASENYAHFEQLLGRTLAVPAFGENLTTSGLLEHDVCIGDEFRIGAARVQVTSPRVPCAKLAGKHGEPRMVRWVFEGGCCGFYLRVLDPAPLCAGAAIERLARPRAGWTVRRLLAAFADTQADEPLWREIAAIPELSTSFREFFVRRLDGEDVFGE